MPAHCDLPPVPQPRSQLQSPPSPPPLLEGVSELDIGLLEFDAEWYSLALASDLDALSKSLSKSHTWYSVLLQAQLRRTADNRFSVEWGEQSTVETHTAANDRSMELSELVQYSGRLLAMCDRTGILYKIDLKRSAAIPRWVVADGDGNDVKPFKGEWATVKDGKLWVGSPGVRWLGGAGQVLHRNPEWVKSMDSRGHLENHDWGPIYAALQRAVNGSAAGFMWHEAVHFDSMTRRWLFVPRKWSAHEAPGTSADQQRGANWLLLASEDFSRIDVRQLGEVEPEWGFTSVRKVPGTRQAFVALKVREVKGEPQQTKLTVFDAEGRFLMDPPYVDVPGTVKYEGLEFTAIPSVYRWD